MVALPHLLNYNSYKATGRACCQSIAALLFTKRRIAPSIMTEPTSDDAFLLELGLRGAGKTTLGKRLAENIGWTFIELNKEIERQNGLSVAEILALYGQEGFRRMEQIALVQALSRKEPVVLATGGGIVSEPLTFDL